MRPKYLLFHPSPCTRRSLLFQHFQSQVFNVQPFELPGWLLFQPSARRTILAFHIPNYFLFQPSTNPSNSYSSLQHTQVVSIPAFSTPKDSAYPGSYYSIPSTPRLLLILPSTHPGSFYSSLQHTRVVSIPAFSIPR